ncbi:S41 family peptidase [Pedobacter sp. 22226]|uniref:S41 family peptidase n=1 Tax=Pedobacter sp. 22226 TaxID=3453894 RepID=UPI003F85BB8B
MNYKVSPLKICSGFPLFLMGMLVLCLTAIIPSGCRKENAQSYKGAEGSFERKFEEFWTKMNLQYVYWDRDDTDWEKVYSIYSPKFANLTNSSSDTKLAVRYFREMTSTLIDSHYSISFFDPLISDSVINPVGQLKRKSSSFYEPYNYQNAVTAYLDGQQAGAYGDIIENGSRLRLTIGTINKDIVYFNCNFFALRRAYYSDGNTAIKSALYKFFSLLKNPGSVKGLIFDVRSNAGGDIADLNFLAGKMIYKDAAFGFSRGKNGLGKVGYLPWVSSGVSHESGFDFHRPIIILQDANTASLSETLILALKAGSNSISIGESTYGATGPISDSGIFNAGGFDIAGFAQIRASSVEFESLERKSLEGIGIGPDNRLSFDLKSLINGKDPALELAINKIH